MIRQQNVSSRVKPHFDPFSFPSVSAVKEMVELCGCVRVCGAGGDRESREAYECIHTLTMICFMSGH